ncbi:DCC-interacting protein 13-alpha [Bagarius yarrelli]|uniref:DCC-interacting protein 13-alpha n=1 Tax=Bagarius yarrelli TaxID=175774 RepID=A0A556TI14_BAGYA|nr:DCC-interacting protein 13-alpha [Bagarius yarrelli]
MPAVHKLLLEEALQDSPQVGESGIRDNTEHQTRTLLSVFEEDASTLTDYSNQLLQSMQRVFGAQNEMALATEQLSKQLLQYEKQNFALGKGDEEVINTLHHFAKSMEELNSLHVDLASQMADRMVFPMVQFREKDLTEISTLKEIFGIASDEHEAAMIKYSRLPKRRENEKLKSELVSEVAYCRRKQHQASMQYYCALNALQYRKRVAMLEPMLGYTQAQINFFKKGIDLISKKMDSFLASVSSMSESVQAQLDAEAESMRMTQKELLSVDDVVYMPDQDQAPVNRTLIQKAGYLNIRKSMILQAESKKEYEEWICTINNISRQIYLTDNPEAVAIRLNQTAIQAVTPITSFEKRAEGSPNPDRAKPGAVVTTSVKKTPAVPEPEDLIAPGTPIQFDIVLPASEFLDQNRAGGRRTNPFGETEVDGSSDADGETLLSPFYQAAHHFHRTAEEVIYEAMRQVLAARAIHNIFKTSESHMMVTSSCLRLIDPQTQVTKISFQLRDISQFAAHKENSRLMGFVVEGRDWSEGEEEGKSSFSAFVFESNTEGEKICYTINIGKEITQAKKLMKSVPLTSDGKFLLLENETGDAANGEGKDDLESEA